MANMTARLTSKDLFIQFLPHGVANIHVQHLYFQADIDGGTFKLRVNGEETTDITMTGVVATDLIAINAALDALPNLTAGDIVATGTDIIDITLTAIVNFWYTIQVSDDQLTGNTSADPNLQTKVTTQGSILITLSGEASQFSWEATIETTDVTPISQMERHEIPVASAANWDLSLYKANQIWAIQIYEGQWGYLYLYPEGKFVGKELYAMQALFDKVSESYPDHDSVEVEVSGSRQGAWIIPPHSVYRV